MTEAKAIDTSADVAELISFMEGVSFRRTHGDLPSEIVRALAAERDAALSELAKLRERTTKLSIDYTVALDEKGKALDELAKLRAEAEWRPISEAPKTSDDFTSGAIEILAWSPDETARHGGDHRVVWWEPKMGHKGQGRWQCDADFEVHPTLWRPLPKPFPSPPKDPAHD